MKMNFFEQLLGTIILFYLFCTNKNLNYKNNNI